MSRQRTRHFAVALALSAVVSTVNASPALAGFLAPAASAHSVAQPQAVVRTLAAHTSREVFGFALASSLSDPTIGYPSWNFTALSTVAFFGLHVDTAGHFVADNGWTVWNSPALTNLVSIAHRNGVKVVVTVILQDFSAGNPSMCSGLQHASATVAQTVQEVKAKGIDGVNIDYEGLDGSCGTTDSYWSQHAMTAFVQKMRAGLGSGYYLSVDTYGSSAVDGYGFFDVVGIAQYADSLFVMAYDLEYSNYRRVPASCLSFCLGPTGPLTGYYYNDTVVASQYSSAVGASKVILGVPYYGRKACVGGTGPNQYPISSVVADSYLDASGEASYYEVRPGSYVVHRDANSAGQERWDTWYNTTLNCTRELYWDDAVSLGKKYDLVSAAGLRGVGIWNLNYGGGAPELWAALQTHFAACSAAGLTASPASPQHASVRVAFTATSSGCLRPMYQFWMLAQGSSDWRVVQPYSPTATFTWSSTGALAGTEQFGVWVRDAGSPGANASNLGRYDTSAASPFTVSTPACTSVAATFAPPPPSPAGTSVTITGGAAGCPNPRYEFWMRAGGSSAWMLLQGYSTTATYAWNSTGALAGTEQFGVWARDASSPAAYDTFTSNPYAVSPSCPSVTAAAAPVSVVHGTGGRVTITAAASGCTNPPRYEFWMRPAAKSTWQLVQGYSTSATYSWNSTGALAGTVYFGVWVCDSGSAAAYDSVASVSVGVT